MIDPNDPIILALQQQIRDLQSHTHDGSNSLQLFPKNFHGIQIVGAVPTQNAEEGTVLLYNNGSGTYKIYVMINKAWRSVAVT